MPQLEYPDEATLASWDIRWDHGAKDGSTLTAEIGIDSNTAKRKALVAWEHRFDFVTWVLGSSSTYDDPETSELKLSRLLPQTFPGLDWLVATKCTSMKPHGRNDWEPTVDEELEESDWDGVATWPDAAVEFLYEQVPYLLVEDDDIISSEVERYVENPAGNPEPGAERLTMPGAGFVYTADPSDEIRFGGAIDQTKIPFDFARTIPTEKWSVGFHRLPYEDVWNPECPLYARLFGTGEGDQVPWIGTINSTEFMGRPIGTTALVGVRPIRRKGIDGNFELDLFYDLETKYSGMNWVWGYQIGGTEATNGWYLVTRSGTFNTADDIPDFDSIYNARDLEGGLFRIGEIPPPPPP